MTNNSPIILDRLAAALRSQGVALKRHQLLHVAAAAFGHHNADAYSAAAKVGELDPPAAETLGTDDRGLAVLRDPASGRVFAVERPRPGRRVDAWANSPYGGVLALPAEALANDAGDDTQTGDAERDDGSTGHPGARKTAGTIIVHTAMVTHRHGTNFHVAATRADLDAKIAEYCAEWWSEAVSRDTDLPEDPDAMDDADLVSAYFGAMEDEQLDYGEDVLSAPAAELARIASTTGGAWVVAHRTGDFNEPVLWWNRRDGWGDLASATPHASPEGRLPTLGMDGTVEWVELPREAVERSAPIGEPTAPVVEWIPVPAEGKKAEVAELLAARGMDVVRGVRLSSLRVEADAANRRLTRTILGLATDRDARELRNWWEGTGAFLSSAGWELDRGGTAPVIVVRGDAGVADATTPDDWIRATRDLLAPVGDRPRIFATFVAEAWINDNAVAVDVDGDDRIDVTYEMLLIGREAATSLDTGDTDHLKEAVRVGDWVSGWSGPFTINVAEAAEESELFDG